MPDKVFKGSVERIAPQGRVERTVTVFETVILITDPEKALLKPGMTSDVKILTSLIKDALLVPNEALKTKDGSTGVYVLEEGIPKFVPVKTGETNGIQTIVVEGIGPDTEVVTAGLKANQKPKKKRFFF